MLGFIFDRFFYHPTRTVYASPSLFGLHYEQVEFCTRDGLTLHGWYFPVQNGDKARGTVLHLHGNAGNVTGHFTHVAWLPAAGWNVLCFDYRGYGQSQGRITRKGSVLDAHAALDYLLSRDDVDGDRVVAFGQSLGGALSVVLGAERREIRGVAVDGAFDHYRKIACWHMRRHPLLLWLSWSVPIIMSGNYNPVDYVKKLSPRPLLVIHGTRDRIVPVQCGRRLYDAAGEPKDIWIVEGVDHYGPLQERTQEAEAKLLAFFERCVQLTTVDTEVAEKRSGLGQ